jgi:hypothetical protein
MAFGPIELSSLAEVFERVDVFEARLQDIEGKFAADDDVH